MNGKFDVKTQIVFISIAKLQVALFDDQDHLGPWLRPNDWYSRMSLNLSWNNVGVVKEWMLYVSDR